MNNSKIDKYQNISDKLNAPVLIEEDIKVTPVDEPYAFIQPYFIDLEESDNFILCIRNAGSGYLILADVYADVDWIKIEEDVEKKALEWSDEPINVKFKIYKEKIPIGDQVGNIIFETRQDKKNIHKISIRTSIPKESASAIIVYPEVIDFGYVPVYKDYEFVFKEDSALSVYLQGDFTNWELERISMQKVDDEFRACVPLDDGEYLYQLDVDGRIVPDPNNQKQVVISEHGVCSKLVLSRLKRSFQLRNAGSKLIKVKIKLDGSAITLSKYDFGVSKGDKVDIDVFVLPHLLKVGRNEFRIDIMVKSELSCSVIVQAYGIINGAMVDVSPKEITLGEIFSGKYNSAIIKAKNIGKGTSEVNIVAKESWLKSETYKLPEGTEMDIPIHIDTEQLSPGKYKANMTVITSNYIHGTDQFNIPIEFNFIRMELEPQEIDFDIMFVGENKEKQIRAKRSDGARMELKVMEDVPSWLDIESAGRQTLKLKIDWSKLRLESDTELDSVITVADERSALSKPMRVRGKILIPHIAVDELKFENGIKRKKSKPLNIRNLGNGKLIIKKIEVSEEQKWINVKVQSKRNLPPKFIVTVDRRFIPKAERYSSMTGYLRIYSNDPIEPITDVFVTF